MFTFGIIGGASLLLAGAMIGVSFLVIRAIIKMVK